MNTANFVFLLLAAATTCVYSRPVNITTRWALPQEGFPHFLRYFKEPATWDDAKAVCGSFGGQLVTVETGERRDAIRAYLKEMDVINNVWCGLQRLTADAPFVWTGGGQSELEDDDGELLWQEPPPLQPERLCVHINPQQEFRWQGSHCDDNLINPFVCQLEVPDWATGPEGCISSFLPSLTITYLPEPDGAGVLHLTSDCGLAGSKTIACKGPQNQDELIRRLSCDRDNEAWSWTPRSATTGITRNWGSGTRHKRESTSTATYTATPTDIQDTTTYPTDRVEPASQFTATVEKEASTFEATTKEEVITAGDADVLETAHTEPATTVKSAAKLHSPSEVTASILRTREEALFPVSLEDMELPIILNKHSAKKSPPPEDISSAVSVLEDQEGPVMLENPTVNVSPSTYGVLQTTSEVSTSKKFEDIDETIMFSTVMNPDSEKISGTPFHVPLDKNSHSSEGTSQVSTTELSAAVAVTSSPSSTHSPSEVKPDDLTTSKVLSHLPFPPLMQGQSKQSQLSSTHTPTASNTPEIVTEGIVVPETTPKTQDASTEVKMIKDVNKKDKSQDNVSVVVMEEKPDESLLGENFEGGIRISEIVITETSNSREDKGTVVEKVTNDEVKSEIEVISGDNPETAINLDGVLASNKIPHLAILDSNPATFAVLVEQPVEVFTTVNPSHIEKIPSIQMSGKNLPPTLNNPSMNKIKVTKKEQNPEKLQRNEEKIIVTENPIRPTEMERVEIKTAAIEQPVTEEEKKTGSLPNTGSYIEAKTISDSLLLNNKDVPTISTDLPLKNTTVEKIPSSMSTNNQPDTTITTSSQRLLSSVSTTNPYIEIAKEPIQEITSGIVETDSPTLSKVTTHQSVEEPIEEEDVREERRISSLHPADKGDGSEYSSEEALSPVQPSETKRNGRGRGLYHPAGPLSFYPYFLSKVLG